ncbi:MAG: dihydrofolate reductase [bacterium]
MIAIAAMSRNRVIGADGRIPWHVSEDLKFFKRTTLGHVIVMGRKTYDSLGKPLPGRENWVVSREANIPGVTVLRSFEEIAEPADGRQLYVIGGAQLYAALLPRCAELLLTRVDREVEGDTYFPAFEADFDAGEVLESGEGYEIRRHRKR